MKNIKLPIKCPHCEDDFQVEVNLFTAEHKIIKPKVHYLELMEILDHYKKIKGFDRISTWDSVHKRRGLAVAKRLRKIFSKLERPNSVSKECITFVAVEAKRVGYSFTLETVVKKASDWLVAKMRG